MTWTSEENQKKVNRDKVFFKLLIDLATWYSVYRHTVLNVKQVQTGQVRGGGVGGTEWNGIRFENNYATKLGE